MKATCKCGKTFDATWYRLEAAGPMCDECNIVPKLAKQLETMRDLVRSYHDTYHPDCKAGCPDVEYLTEASALLEQVKK